ncbi:hypothetical protein NDN08_000316 [Rhodosorus marinus]|uniref:Protein MIS12 homolog n=1 Tax=Rhodosorus marinus TaxID=101924 RepID=A0AAV8UR65_9RHOD|nr:hypothetical protein NDN08_000316 [Rhodosorus marinus]
MERTETREFGQGDVEVHGMEVEDGLKQGLEDDGAKGEDLGIAEETNGWEVRAQNFFGFDPRECIDELTNSAGNYLCDSVDALEASLKRDFRDRDTSKGVSRVLSTVQSSLDSNFDKLELYLLRNIFNVPENVKTELVLSSARPASKSDIAEEQNLDAEIQQLRAELAMGRSEGSMLDNQATQLMAQLQRFDSVHDSILKFTSEPEEFRIEELLKLTDELKQSAAYCEQKLLSVQG